MVDLELEFTLDVGYRLFDMLDDTAITKHENGYTVKLTLPENNWLYDFLMSFGNKVTIIRINEVVPSDPLQDFYGIPNADYLKTTIPLLQGAGAKTASIQDILQRVSISQMPLKPRRQTIPLIKAESTKKNVIPAVSTYKLRNSEIYYKGIRVMPSYIMTGGKHLNRKVKSRSGS